MKRGTKIIPITKGRENTESVIGAVGTVLCLALAATAAKFTKAAVLGYMGETEDNAKAKVTGDEFTTDGELDDITSDL